MNLPRTSFAMRRSKFDHIPIACLFVHLELRRHSNRVFRRRI